MRVDGGAALWDPFLYCYLMCAATSHLLCFYIWCVYGNVFKINVTQARGFWSEQAVCKLCAVMINDIGQRQANKTDEYKNNLNRTRQV